MKRMFLNIIMLMMSLNVVLADGLQNKLDKIKIYTEEYPPISFKNKNGEVDGLGVDIARHIMKKLGMKQKIKLQPWARIYKIALNQKNVLIFSVSRNIQRDKLFQWVGPIYSLKDAFYVRKDSNIKIKSLEDARKLKSIGVLRDSFDVQYFKSLGFKNLSFATQYKNEVRKLMKKRLDCITLTNVTAKDIIEKAGYKMSDLKKEYTFLGNGSYFVFSKNTPYEVVEAWRQELEKMREDGSLWKLREKWLGK